MCLLLIVLVIVICGVYFLTEGDEVVRDYSIFTQEIDSMMRLFVKEPKQGLISPMYTRMVNRVSVLIIMRDR